MNLKVRGFSPCLTGISGRLHNFENRLKATFKILPSSGFWLHV